tara:strand:+ start:81 stop:545 length:465 start_codon:yes stop_codon:yes gene_type:complete
MITDKQAKFIDFYCESGDAMQSAINAGYKNSHTLRNQAWKLKKELAIEINKKMLEKFVDKAPVAFNSLVSLMKDSESDTVKLQAAKDIMDRGGFKPSDRIVLEEDQKTIPELEAELISLVGRKRAELLLGKEKDPPEESIPIPKETEETHQHIN